MAQLPILLPGLLGEVGCKRLLPNVTMEDKPKGKKVVMTVSLLSMAEKFWTLEKQHFGFLHFSPILMGFSHSLILEQIQSQARLLFGRTPSREFGTCHLCSKTSREINCLHSAENYINIYLRFKTVPLSIYLHVQSI